MILLYAMQHNAGACVIIVINWPLVIGGALSTTDFYTLGTNKKDLDVTEKAKEAYDKADEEAKDLPSTHPIRLGLSLNYSVFHYEIRNDSSKACELAKTVGFFFGGGGG